MSLNNFSIIEMPDNVAAIFQTDSATIFDSEDVKPVEILEKKRGYIPWGESNDQPSLILEKIRKSDVMSPNMQFNVLTAYGNGLMYKMADGSKVEDKDVIDFFRRNNMVKYLLEHMTDIKHFSFAITLLFVSKDGSKIVKLKQKEAFHCRFEENNKETGKIENVFFANWEDSPGKEDVQSYPVLDQEDPYTDLLVRLGKEPDPVSGKNAKVTTDRIFAIVTRLPTPGYKYYPFPAYASHFNSGWYDISAMIPIAKKAKMANGMSVKYHVEFHKDYFEQIFSDENITDPLKKKERKTLEFNNVKDFLSGIENSGKVWYSGYYLDPNGKENHMIKINLIDSKKEGGDWIEDSEEAANMQCYAMGIHPSLIGAVPGKSKGSLSGSDKRELFTMKQALETPFRNMAIIPFDIIKGFNKWDENIVFDIPHLMLTTLDEGKDAKEVTNSNNLENDN